MMLALMLLGLVYHGHAQCTTDFSTAQAVAGGVNTAQGLTYTFACISGYYPSGVATCVQSGSDGWDGPTCNAVTVCTNTQYESVAPIDGTSDRTCTELTVCTNGQYESGAPTATADRECAGIACTGTGIDTGSTAGACTCASGYFGTVTYDATSITGGCTAWTVCTGTQYESVAPTATADRTCTAWTVCTGTQYESGAPTATADRTCTALTVCTGTQYESVAATATADRTCTALTVCTGTQYESVAATATSDRTCTAMTVCTIGQYQSVAATATSDRTCTGIACTGTGIDTGSTAGACTCASGYTGTVTYDATSITGGCFRTCAGEEPDARVFNFTSGMASVPAGDASTAKVEDAACMCPDGEYGIIQTNPSVGGYLTTCTEIEAGAAEHQIEISVQVDQNKASFDSAQDLMTRAVQSMAWGIAGLEFAHIKFNSAMENADNAARTDIKITLIFPSEAAADAAHERFSATALSVSSTPISLQVSPATNVVMLTIGEVTLTPLNGASQLGYSVPAAVAAAALLW